MGRFRGLGIGVELSELIRKGYLRKKGAVHSFWIQEGDFNK